MRLLGYNSPWDTDVIVPFTFFFIRNDPILCQGIKLIPWLSLSGEMPFTKVCVTAPYELFIVYCLYLQINIRIKFKRRGGKGAQESQK